VQARCGAHEARKVADMAKRAVDLLVVGDGFRSTVYLLLALTGAGDGWITDNIGPDAHRLGSGVAVEHRYIGDIVRGAIADGLGVRVR
jgi:hypothetical protein